MQLRRHEREPLHHPIVIEAAGWRCQLAIGRALGDVREYGGQLREDAAVWELERRHEAKGRDARELATIDEALRDAIDAMKHGRDARLEAGDVGGERARQWLVVEVHDAVFACGDLAHQRIVPMGTMKSVHERLEVRHLRLVREIAAEGSVTRAAHRLHLSQSAVSHQLLALERDLGTRLFDRIGKTMRPTPVGAQLLSAAQRLLADLEELELSLDRSRGDARMLLRVTTSCFTGYGWLPSAMARFGERHPTVELEIVVEATRRAVPALLADEIDFAIVTEPPKDEAWQKVPIVDSELVVIAAKEHPVTERLRRGTLPWPALHDCEIYVHDIADPDLVRLTRAIGRRPVVRKIPLSEALLDLVRYGRGVALVDRWTLDRHLGADLVALSTWPRATRTFHAVWRRSNPRGLPIEHLIEAIEAASARTVHPTSRRPRARVAR